MLMNENLRQQLHQLKCVCGDARVIIQNFGNNGPGWVSIDCMGVGCEEETMSWFDTEEEAIAAWGQKYGIEEEFVITYRNGERIRIPQRA